MSCNIRWKGPVITGELLVLSDSVGHRRGVKKPALARTLVTVLEEGSGSWYRVLLVLMALMAQ
jgi:hypothetical protein